MPSTSSRLKLYVQLHLKEAWQEGRIHLLTGALGGVLCFLPLFLGVQSHLEDNALRRALENSEWDVYAASSLTLTAPLIAETCFDLYSKYRENSSKKRKTLEEAQRESEIQDTKRKSGGGGAVATFTDAEKIVYLLGMIVSPATAFFHPLVADIGLLGK